MKFRLFARCGLVLLFGVSLTGCRERQATERVPATRATPASVARGAKATPHSGTVEERVRACMLEIIKAEQSRLVLAAEMRKDLAADDLDLVEITMALEEEFDIEIPDAEADKLRTFGDWVRLVETRVKGR